VTPLIKSAGAAAVRGFAGSPATIVATREQSGAEPCEPDPLETERATLLAEIGRLQSLREQDAATSRRAVETAREEGRKQGLGQAETREADRLAILRESLEESAAAFTARLDLLDTLAPELAREALGKLFANAEAWSEPVEAMIARQLAVLRRSSLVAISVSPLDFPDAAALAALSASLRAQSVRVEADQALRAGQSRIQCRLGHIELDVRQQWQTLSALLVEMGA
jgi:flagellar assembly protein FliH